MNIGGGEAADQMVRMMLTGTEVTVRLGASALKNLLAITLALAKHHSVGRRSVSGNQLCSQNKLSRYLDKRANWIIHFSHNY